MCSLCLIYGVPVSDILFRDGHLLYGIPRTRELQKSDRIVHQAGLPVKNKYQSVIGNSDPDLILGLSSSFRYKDFNLSISLDGRLGGMMYSWTEQALWHAGSHPDSDNQWRYDEVVNGKQNYVASGSKVVNGSASYGRAHV